MPRRSACSLSAGAMDCDSVEYDWSKGCGEHWDFLEAEKCFNCGRTIFSDRSVCLCGHEIELAGPMMNYFYPLPYFDLDTHEAAEAIMDLPLCLIIAEETCPLQPFGLALTGGGMDLSWEICDAYVILGFIPPRKYWRLPEMSGMLPTARTRRVLAAIRRGLTLARWQLKRDVQATRETGLCLKSNHRAWIRSTGDPRDNERLLNLVGKS